MKGEVVKADSGSSRRPHRRGVKVLEWICSYTHALTAGGPPPSIINPSGTCSLSQESAPAACETNRGMRSKYGRGTHLEQPHVRVRDFCQHIPHVDQFKVASADLRASTRGCQSVPLSSGLDEEGWRPHQEVDFGYLCVQDDSAVLSNA